jgi:hypothetical protein
MRRLALACALVAACADPTAAPRVEQVEQTIDGMPVYHHAARRLVGSDGRVVLETQRALDARVRRSPPVFVDDDASVLRRIAPGATRARARKFWVPYADQLVAAWVVEAYVGDDLVRTIVAADGHVIAQDSLVADAAFTYEVWAETTGEKHPLDGPTADAVPHPTGIPDGSYPAYVAPSQVTVDSLVSTGDPWLASGATQTAGNNVDAYTDLTMPDGLSDGDFRASVTSPGAFVRAYDVNAGPLESTQQQMASVTSLFYIVNWLHDFWYDAGFTEAAGNAQASNYGRGGVEGDALLAEAQDNALGGSRNNANMATPDDGMSPRMQVYLWNGKDDRALTLAPSGRSPAIGVSSFGPASYDASGTLVLGDPADGCMPLTNDVAGELVLVDRGGCTYRTKTTNAQAAGAVGLVVANNADATNPPTLGDDSSLTEPVVIPSVSVTQAEGVAIKADIEAGTVTATLHRTLAADLDGSLDATLIAHELGHYIHHRLSVCNNAMCRAMSEGWGDFCALLLTARAGDNLHGAFPFGDYATQGSHDDPGYFGIRREPYSVDFGIDALMFHHMSAGAELPTTHPLDDTGTSNAEVHNAGEVWASALWEVYVALQDDGAARGLSFDDIRQKMASYVVTGLALAPDEATPLETRDALLAGALAHDTRDYTVRIEAFARRGFGSCAVSAPRASLDFVGIVDSTLVTGNPQVTTSDVDDGCDEDGIVDSGETAHVRLRAINEGHAALTNVRLSLASPSSALEVRTPVVQRDRLEPFETIDLDFEIALPSGIRDPIGDGFALHVEADGACAASVDLPLATRLNVDDVPDASATDSFDAQLSDWEPWLLAWRHDHPTSLSGIWHADDLSTASDTRLTSPLLTADATKPLSITIRHRYSFEYSDSTAWDGGVLEYSIDNGDTWADLATLAATGYTGTITSQSGNVLGDQDAFVGTSDGYPAYTTTTLDVGTALAGKQFRVRFRLGTDAASGGPGWDIDEIAFDGIAGTPFPAQLADDGNCGPRAPLSDPIVSGGGGCSTTPGAAPWLVALALLLTVRRRSRSRA